MAAHPHLKTPNIDRLAKEGVYFKNAFCATTAPEGEDGLERVGLHEALHGALQALPERERLVVLGRMAGQPLRELGEQLALTKQRVKQIEKAALARLRRDRRLRTAWGA